MTTPASAVDQSSPRSPGLSLAPLLGLRYTAGNERLGRLLCPPYDVIDDDDRAALLTADPDNAVQIVLPRAGRHTGDDPAAAADAPEYEQANATLERWVRELTVAVDPTPVLYVYEMRTPADGDEAETVTRGLLGAVELRDPADGVILPHENTMAGPVADRLALMDATNANLEPIYLVYDGGGAASAAVAAIDSTPEGTSAAVPGPLAATTTPDGVQHRLWAITDPATLDAIEADLSTRHALIADGHHRYATYRQLAAQRRSTQGPGPWDRGLALLVDSSAYGPQVHPIHRVIPGLSLDEAISGAATRFATSAAGDLASALAQLADQNARPGFCVVVTDGQAAAVISDPDPAALDAARQAGEPQALLKLDVTVLHRVLIEGAWSLTDDEHHVSYAHDVDEALSAARAANGVAVILRATPVAAVAAVAAAGARMPRKSTLFTPKPASGMVMRRFADQRA